MFVYFGNGPHISEHTDSYSVHDRGEEAVGQLVKPRSTDVTYEGERHCQLRFLFYDGFVIGIDALGFDGFVSDNYGFGFGSW